MKLRYVEQLLWVRHWAKHFHFRTVQWNSWLRWADFCNLMSPVYNFEPLRPSWGAAQDITESSKTKPRALFLTHLDWHFFQLIYDCDPVLAQTHQARLVPLRFFTDSMRTEMGGDFLSDLWDITSEVNRSFPRPGNKLHRRQLTTN